jgi:hypothetical protein
MLRFPEINSVHNGAGAAKVPCGAGYLRSSSVLLRVLAVSA